VKDGHVKDAAQDVPQDVAQNAAQDVAKGVLGAAEVRSVKVLILSIVIFQRRTGLYATIKIQRTNAGLWAMRGSKRRNLGGCQYRLPPRLCLHNPLL